MRFQYLGKAYSIEFRRHHEVVRVVNKDGEVEEVTSKYPTTRVALAEVIEGKRAGDWPELVSATVNCLPTDKFTLEGGRQYALRKLSETLPSDLKSLVWTAYMDRSREPNKMERLEAENETLREKVEFLMSLVRLMGRDE